MARLFRFVQGADAFNITEAIAASPNLSRLRDQLTARYGQRGADVVEDMMVVVMRRAGDHYVAIRGAQIDQIMDIRTRIDGIYGGLMRRGGDSTIDVDAELQRLLRDYMELDEAINNASSPVDSFRLLPSEQDALGSRFRGELLDPDGTQSPRFREQDSQAGGRLVDEDFRDRAGRLPGDEGYAFNQSRAHRKDWRPDPDNPSEFINTFEDGSTGRLRVEEVDGREILIVTSRQRDGTELTIREEAVFVDPYGNKPRTTSLLNAHHGVQAAPMEARFGGFGYDRHAAPTIWLRNSRTGSPHARITAIEGRTSEPRFTEPGSRLTDQELGSVTYDQMRRIAEREMRSVGVSEQAIRNYLTAHDVYFRDHVFPRIDPSLYGDLLGTWRPAKLWGTP
ncbi:hypothetical protein QTO30_01605 [Yoonia sp. GPGPB17]|uniref:hypothetical protein n=1 Tax=Yoonia sp. GPGPB17 TaxID=3026147 RepID=UPI0030C38397